MANLSSITNNYFTKVSESYSSNLSTTIAALATTVSVNSASTYSDGDYVVLTVQPGTTSQATFYGMKSGNTFINCVWTEGNLAIGHTLGATIMDYDSATHYLLLVKAMQQQHAVDGTHSAVTATSLSISGITWANLTTGWLEANETWVYASATTFTITGNSLTKYPIGTKLRLIQSASTKYFYVTGGVFGGGTTTITIYGGTDYTLANAAISSNFYSYSPNPQGYQAELSYTPTFANLTVGNSAVVSKFTLVGKTVNCRFSITIGSTGSVGSSPTMTVPINTATDYIAGAQMGSIALTDTGVQGYAGLLTWVSASTMNILYYRQDSAPIKTAGLSSTAPFTWGTGDTIAGSFTYQIA